MIRSYGLQELAMCYFPYSSPKSASRQLKRWMMRAPRLMDALVAAGYHNGQRLLTPRQVHIIVDYLDPP
mgnify:FL=1